LKVQGDEEDWKEEEALTKKPSLRERVSDEKVRERASVAATGTKAWATFGEEAGKEGARVELEHWPPRVKAKQRQLVPAAKDAR
jgi:hypothetical protein